MEIFSAFDLYIPGVSVLGIVSRCALAAFYCRCSVTNCIDIKCQQFCHYWNPSHRRLHLYCFDCIANSAPTYVTLSIYLVWVRWLIQQSIILLASRPLCSDNEMFWLSGTLRISSCLDEVMGPQLLARILANKTWLGLVVGLNSSKSALRHYLRPAMKWPVPYVTHLEL